MREKILIIEDDEDISEILKFSLEKDGYRINVNPNGLDAEIEINTFKPNLIILDIMLNDTDGFTVCKKISSYNIPIIMITARADIMDKIIGLELGADDYITKPFDIREVHARIRAAIRRRENILSSSQDNSCFSIGSISINENSRSTSCNGIDVILKPKEFDLLAFLFKNPNKVYSRSQLLNSIWGYDFIGDSRTIDVHITRLRQKLKDEINIETIFGVGYMLKGKYDDN